MIRPSSGRERADSIKVTVPRRVFCSRCGWAERGFPGAPQTGLAQEHKMPIDRGQRRRRTRGRGFVGIKSPGAGRRTLPRQGRYRSSNCSAPVTRRVSKLSPEMLFEIFLPEPHNLMHCSLERAITQLQKSLNRSSPAQNPVPAPAAARGFAGGYRRPEKLGFA